MSSTRHLRDARRLLRVAQDAVDDTADIVVEDKAQVRRLRDLRRSLQDEVASLDRKNYDAETAEGGAQ